MSERNGSAGGPVITRWLTQYPSAFLLGMQVAAIVVYPFVGEREAGRAALSLIGTLVLGLAIWTIRSTANHVVPALVLGVLAVVLSLVEIVSPSGSGWHLVSDVVHSLFYFYTSYALVRYLFGDDWVTSDDLFAVGAAFTVVAWGFAYVFDAVQILVPSSFIAYQGAGDRTWFELLYLSFANLTSVGLSDIVPVTRQARAWSMLEQLAGVLYVAMVISRMVSLTVRRARH